MNGKKRALDLLANGFATEFGEYVSADERFHELLMDMSIDFVNKEIPVTDEDDAYELAYLLCQKVYAGKI